MAEYAKPWLSVDEQIDRLAGHGIEVEDHGRATSLLQAVGYYRLTGYLYPFRGSEQHVDDEGRTRIRVLSDYRAGTTLRHAEDIIDFDRRLRMLVMDGVERIEVAVRMRIGYVLGRRSPFSYEDPNCFTEAFTAESTDARDAAPSRHVQWLQRVNNRKASSDEQFVEHFREKYDDRMPVWALTEILELGHLSVLYRGMHQQDAEEIALAFSVPTKKIMISWLASLNYVRNVAAHHSRLFNRKLQHAPARPKAGQIPVLDHLRDEKTAKGIFGTYNALAVIAYILPSIDADSDWAKQLAALLREFPASHALTVASMGAPQVWESLDLWRD
ncbi:Abi family protein [Promicromonospora sp. NPDC023987]|uniref:Abi family protein n=1 Tax=Promicromonospora sp. NPDC023987 TaxID=3155360 RepID=UPI003403F0A9